MQIANLIKLLLFVFINNFNEFSRGGAENIAPAQIRYNIVEHGPKILLDKPNEPSAHAEEDANLINNPVDDAGVGVVMRHFDPTSSAPKGSTVG